MARAAFRAFQPLAFTSFVPQTVWIGGVRGTRARSTTLDAGLEP